MRSLKDVSRSVKIKIESPKIEKIIPEFKTPKIPSVDELRREMEKGAKQLSKDVVSSVLDEIMNSPEVKNITDKGRVFTDKINEIKQGINKLQDLVSLNNLKESILNELEGICEAYLRDKLDILNSINLKGNPDIEIDFNGKEISINVIIFILMSDTDKSNYKKEWIATIEFNANINITNPSKPEIKPILTPNQNISNEKMKEIQQSIENNKRDLTIALIDSIIEDYIPVLKLINEPTKIFG
ncbi:hypothetical protein [Clostridium sp. L74]|uniref:hypothetical protein n=1 Tax=Clostridium sp. L74 TaxID=1560217 RepID=UPI0006AB78C5|nr:hypothetical protein [Clostridium sp. L74]KOR25230.1 hypothetical protein ND00_19230 [Clostridium sp. L74]